jgi:hypothetical protein
MPWEKGRWVGPEPTVEELGAEECACCRAEGVPLHASRIEYGPLHESYGRDDVPPFRAICDLCAGTMASTWDQHGRHGDSAEILKAICFVGNAVIRAIREPKESRDDHDV